MFNPFLLLSILHLFVQISLLYVTLFSVYCLHSVGLLSFFVYIIKCMYVYSSIMEEIKYTTTTTTTTTTNN